jgi:hypothetical protein
VLSGGSTSSVSVARDALRSILRPTSSDVFLGPESLRALKAVLESEGSRISLRDFLRSCGATPCVKGAEDATVPINPTSVRRREALIARSEHRAYDALVASVRRVELGQVCQLLQVCNSCFRDSCADCPSTLQSQQDSFSSYRQQLAIGSSVLLSLFSAVALGYYGGLRVFANDASKVCCVCSSSSVQ